MGTKSQVKYIDLLKRSDEEVQSEQVGFQAEEAQQQLDADILATKKALSTAKRELDTAESAFPYNTSTIIDAQIAIEGYEDGLKRLKTLKSARF